MLEQQTAKTLHFSDLGSSAAQVKGLLDSERDRERGRDMAAPSVPRVLVIIDRQSRRARYAQHTIRDKATAGL